jgi:hypothetical protein
MLVDTINQHHQNNAIIPAILAHRLFLAMCSVGRPIFSLTGCQIIVREVGLKTII